MAGATDAAPRDAGGAESEDDEWYPKDSSVLMKPAENKSGSGSFDVFPEEKYYTKYFVCHGSGEIRVSDIAPGETPIEPEVWPCNGVPVESVSVFDNPGKRTITVEVSDLTESDWSLMAVRELPEGTSISQ